MTIEVPLESVANELLRTGHNTVLRFRKKAMVMNAAQYITHKFGAVAALLAAALTNAKVSSDHQLRIYIAASDTPEVGRQTRPGEQASVQIMLHNKPVMQFDWD